jgi:hypothetical protein
MISAALFIPRLFPRPALALAAARPWRSSASTSRAYASPGMAQEYDLVTLGAGSGGTRASRFAAQYYGAKVACVELPFGFVSSGDVGGAAWGPGAGAESGREVRGCARRGAAGGVARPPLGARAPASQRTPGGRSPSPNPRPGAGGTCVIRGCVPKKLLVYASAFQDEFDDAGGRPWGEGGGGRKGGCLGGRSGGGGRESGTGVLASRGARLA